MGVGGGKRGIRYVVRLGEVIEESRDMAETVRVRVSKAVHTRC